MAVHADTQHAPRIRAVTQILAGAFKAKASVLAPVD